MELTENQAYAKAVEFENMFSLFRDLRVVFQAAAEAKKKMEDVQRQTVPLLKELNKRMDEKKKAEQEIADINRMGEERKKQLNEDESNQYAMYKKKLAEWKKRLKEEEDRFNAMIAGKDKELSRMISEKTEELEAIEKRLAEVNREYEDVKKLFV